MPISIILIAITIIAANALGYKDVSRQALNGILAGLIATIGLEIVRATGFRLGGMPGSMPRLMGVIMLDRFALGPNWASDLTGWAYHFWNGASFGIIFSLLVGQGKLWYGWIFGLLIALGLFMSPVVKSLGIGLFGLQFGSGYEFPLTVILAHLAFGSLLGWYITKRNKELPDILSRIKVAFKS